MAQNHRKGLSTDASEGLEIVSVDHLCSVAALHHAIKEQHSDMRSMDGHPVDYENPHQSP